MWWFWFDGGRRVEGREYLARLLQHAGDTASPEARVEALCGLGMLMWGQQSAAGLAAARELLEEAVAIRRRSDDRGPLAIALDFLAHAAWDLRDMVTARRLLRESLELSQKR
jgi:hypothetical protein